MPIYEYKCDHCDHQLEKLQKISDEPMKNCPECGEDSLRKLVSAAAFKLKGTGWYETDFKDKKTNQDKKPKNDSKSDDSDNKKTETKATPEKKESPTTKKETAKASTTVTKPD